MTQQATGHFSPGQMNTLNHPGYGQQGHVVGAPPLRLPLGHHLLVLCMSPCQREVLISLPDPVLQSQVPLGVLLLGTRRRCVCPPISPFTCPPRPRTDMQSTWAPHHITNPFPPGRLLQICHEHYILQCRAPRDVSLHTSPCVMSMGDGPPDNSRQLMSTMSPFQ